MCVCRLKEKNKGRSSSISRRHSSLIFQIELIIAMAVIGCANFLLLVLLASSIDAFYLPGLAPNVFCRKAVEDSKCKVSAARIELANHQGGLFVAILAEGGSVCQSARLCRIGPTLRIFLVSAAGRIVRAEKWTLSADLALTSARCPMNHRQWKISVKFSSVNAFVRHLTKCAFGLHTQLRSVPLLFYLVRLS